MTESIVRGGFYALALGGIAAAFAVMAVLLVRAVRTRDADVFPRSIPWGHAGVGLVLAAATFWIARLVRTGGWPDVTDPWGLVVVLLIASAGFGGVFQWWDGRGERPRVAWTVPLALSSLLGLLGGLSTLAV